MERAERYAEILSEMIRVPTVGAYHETDFSRFFAFHEVMRRLFPNVFATCETEVFGGSLLIRWKGSSADRPVLFMNHHDVVAAEGVWSHEPFSGDIAEGKVWGRGALDTKGPLMCMFQAAEELIAQGFVPQNDIYFESACTEECDGSGAQMIAQVLEDRGVHFAFSLDEGGLILYDPIGGSDGTFAMIGIAEKGCAEIRFLAKSAGGHASRPGKNTPLVRLGKFMAAVDRSHAFPPHCGDVVKEMLFRFSSKTHGALRFLLKRSYRLGWLLQWVLPKVSPTVGSMMQTTTAFTMAGGSEAPNILPQTAWVMGNMRYSHHQGMKNSFAAIRKIADRFGVEMEVTDPGLMTELADFRAPEFKLIEKAVGTCFSEVIPVPYIAASASDNRFMGRVSDNCFGFAPLRVSDQQLNSIHGLNENVDVAALPPAVDFYKMMMQEGCAL